MNPAVRLCIAFALHFMTVAHASLETFWSKRFGTPTQTYLVQETRYDDAGNVIVAGMVMEAETGADLWVVKLKASTGEVMWTFRRNGKENRSDKLGGIAVLKNGDVYVAGGLVNEPVTGETPDFDAYLARVDGASGLAIWENDGIGNIGNDAWHAVALDGAENPVVTGVLTLIESNLGGEIWTGTYNGATGELNWSDTHFAFETNILDQGERVFVAPDGNIYVQGFHAAGNFAGVNYQPTVQILSYTPDGKLRFATRFREAPNARAYGFLRNGDAGFFVGLIEVPPVANIPIITVATGKIDGTFGVEVSLPSIAGLPVISLADNGDVLFTGRGNPTAGPAGIIAGRLAPADLATRWVRNLPAAAGPSAGFAHTNIGLGGSVVAGIAPGSASPDLGVGTFSSEGVAVDGVFLDGSAAAGPSNDLAPAGPALATNRLNHIAVTVAVTSPAGDREILTRVLRPAGGGNPPVISIVSPDPATANIEAFAPFKITAAASDPDNDAIGVEFFADGVSIGVDTTFPFEVPHTFASTGTHTIEAIATDATTATTSTGPITIVAHVPRPVVNTGGAARSGATTGVFSGSVGNLPLGGTARFLFNFTGPTNTLGFSTASVNVPPGVALQPVSIPFTFPEPHRSYDYFLEITATDGSETVTVGSTAQTFVIPNAPVLPRSDFVFFARGALSGNAAANDLDADAGETFTVTYGSGPYPGVFTTDGNSFTFVPNRDFTGELIIPYTVDDGHGSTQTETLVVRNALHYAGSYRALSSPDSTHLGGVDISVNRAGRATAAVYLDGARFAAAGELKQLPNDAVGFTAVLRKPSQPDRQLRVTWAADRQLTAEVGVENDGFEILYTATGIRAGESTFSEPQHYTLQGVHTNVSGNAEGRLSAFASLQIAPSGKTTFRGKLGDGTPFVTTTRPREDGKVPIYTGLRTGSFLIGLLQPDPTAAAAVGPGLATVAGPATRATPGYAADYRDLVAFSGPRYIPAGIGGSPLTFTAMPRMLIASVSAGGLPAQEISLPVWITRSGKVSGITGITRISLDGATGEFSGAFLPQGKARTVPFSGVLRPASNDGMGIFRGAGAMGQIQIVPQ